MDVPTPPPHVRLSEMEKNFDDALKNPSTRKRLKQAGAKLAEEIAEMLREAAPQDETPRTA